VLKQEIDVNSRNKEQEVNQEKKVPQLEQRKKINYGTINDGTSLCKCIARCTL
jgi:hypothetical protein